MIYLDNASTTKVSKHVIESMLPYFDKCYGNASSIHTLGLQAKKELECARDKIAKLLGVTSHEIYFTSGGSESDNWAIESACELAKLFGKNHIITSQIEHDAILNTLKRKEDEGFTVTYLPVYENGIIHTDDLENTITNDTFLVTIMYANNEIGTIQPVNEIGKICKSHNIIFHTDAVQAVGHIPLELENVDMLSASGHKFNGPKGVGFLYCKKQTKLTKLIEGGPQERNKHAGTENIPSIIGMATALEDSINSLQETMKTEAYLRDKLIENLSKISGSKINGDTTLRLPNNVNISFNGIEGEELILLLDSNGICTSSGSACTSGSLHPSHVLLALGLSKKLAKGSLRLTLSRFNTEEEIDNVISVLPKIIDKLRK